MHLLVAGGSRVDAGKTTFSVGLVDSIDGATGYKPRAGNDYWYDHEDAMAALRSGRLYGKDIRRLVEAAGVDGPEERYNPVHRLWRPTPGESGLLGESDRTFLVDRVRTAEGDRFVVNEAAIDDGLFPEPVAESLPIEAAIGVRSVEAFNRLMAEQYVPAFERLRDRIVADPPAVVESYGAIATPTDGIDFDAVAVVDPTRVRIYDGDRYLKARSVASGSLQEGRREEPVDRVVDLVDPETTVRLPALSSAERADPAAIVDAYRPAYDEFLSVAVE